MLTPLPNTPKPAVKLEGNKLQLLGSGLRSVATLGGGGREVGVEIVVPWNFVQYIA